MAATPTPFFSVIVPVRDDAAHLRRTLRALARSSFCDWELIVADDGSVDDSGDAARAHGARVVRSNTPQGAASARNLGARCARGRFLFFLDSDCEPHADALELAARVLAEDRGLDGVFGSYDDAPDDAGFASQFKNLFHHYIHQRGRERATTFWTGCGAIRRSVFRRLGGFDPDQRMLEDVELGLRLRRSGGRLKLSKTVQVKHLKAWSLTGLLCSDVFDRAIPWANLIIERDGFIDDLNLRKRDRWSATLVFLVAASGVLAALAPLALVAGSLLATLLLLLNRDFYGFLRRRRGLRFALASVPMHWLYFGYSTLGLVAGLTAALVRKTVLRRPTPADRSRRALATPLVVSAQKSSISRAESVHDAAA